MKLCRVLALIGLAFFAAIPAVADDWTVPGDFPTIQDAVDSSSVADGDRILVGPGYFAGATVTKAVEIRGVGGAVINSGPQLGSYPFYIGFWFPGGGVGSGATICRFRFEDLEFPVFSRGADYVTVTHCCLEDPIQGISNWGGTGWQVSHNNICDLRTSSGGGIGIIIADRYATAGGVCHNTVSHNKISGTLHVHPNDCGGYNGSGIVLYADFRWGFPGAEEISNNRIVKNRIKLTSDTPSVVDVVAIELTENYYPNPDPDPEDNVLFDNAVGFNDLRGTVLTIICTPETLWDENNISRNLGYDKSRGKGLHPKLFGPGGN